MANKLYTIIGGVAYDALQHPTTEIRSAASVPDHEGDFAIVGAAAYPILRFNSVPFGGRVSGSNMIFQFGISDKLLTTSPKIVCLGSSTMAGFGLSAPNRLEDRLNVWLAANATGATLINYALGGQTMAALRPTGSGGTVGRNIDTALADNPTIVLIDEPTNGLGTYSVATQIGYMEEIFNYAFARGVLVVFTGSRPRTPYDATQKARLVDFNSQIAQHPYLKYVTCINFDDFLQSSTAADLRADYDQGDGIHLNATGVQALADDITTFWQRVFKAVTAFNQYQIEKSADGSTGWSVFQTITDMTLNQLMITGETGYYRVRARLKDGIYTDYSETTYLEFEAPPVEQRILIDFGGDGISDDGQTDGGVMTPNNSITTGTPGQDASGKWWNNIVFCRAGELNADLVDIANVATGISITTDKKPGGTFAPVDYSMNYGGTNAAVNDYPASAVRDNVYFHTTAGIVTWTVFVPAGKTATIKIWGNRADAAARVLQIRKAGDVTWQEYNAANNTNYATAVTLAGLTGSASIEFQVKSGSTFGHISVMDITLTEL